MAQAQRQGRVKALNGFPKPKVVCEVTFRIRLWDLMHFNLFHLLHKARLLLGGVLALELYVASLVALSVAHRRVVRLEIFGLVALGLTLIAATFALLTLLAYYLPGKGEAVLVERTILLTDTLLLEETPFRRQAFGWSELVEVAQNGAYIFVYLSNHNAHIIPKRAFVSRFEAAAFFDFARAKCEANNLVRGVS